jgi:hypothetical protein
MLQERPITQAGPVLPEEQFSTHNRATRDPPASRFGIPWSGRRRRRQRIQRGTELAEAVGSTGEAVGWTDRRLQDEFGVIGSWVASILTRSLSLSLSLSLSEIWAMNDCHDCQCNETV